MPFDGLRVLSLESRRSTEIEKLIRTQGGNPFLAASMREVPIDDNPEALAFADRLFHNEFDMMILLTGVGTRLLARIIETKHPAGSLTDALKKIAVVARGSKPIAVLREWGVPVTVAVPEPNTWREILAAIDGRSERRIAIQEYGRPSAELIDGLLARGAQVSTVPVYQWALPEDTGPLREAIRKLAANEFDVAIFTTSVQVDHLLQVAGEMGSEDAVRQALKKMMIASVGPTTSETLKDFRIGVDFEPSHPKMGFLINEAAANAARILADKRGPHA
jgi:uroporphyrinogen-III synthase